MDFKLIVAVLWASWTFIRQIDMVMIPYMLLLRIFPKQKNASFNTLRYFEPALNRFATEQGDEIKKEHLISYNEVDSNLWGRKYYEIEFYLLGERFKYLVNGTVGFLLTSAIDHIEKQKRFPVKNRRTIADGYEIAEPMTAQDIIDHCFEMRPWHWRNVSPTKILIDYTYKRRLSVNLTGPLGILSVYLTTRDDIESWKIWVGLLLPIVLDFLTQPLRYIYDVVSSEILKFLKIYVFRGHFMNRIRSYLTLINKNFRVCDDLYGQARVYRSKYIALWYCSKTNLRGLKRVEMSELMNRYKKDWVLPVNKVRYGLNEIILERKNNMFDGDKTGFTFGYGCKSLNIDWFNIDMPMSKEESDWVSEMLLSLFYNQVPIFEEIEGNVGHVHGVHEALSAIKSLDFCVYIKDSGENFEIFVDDSLKLDREESIFYNSIPYPDHIKSKLFQHNKEFFSGIKLEAMKDVLIKCSLKCRPKSFGNSEWKRYSSDVAIILNGLRKFSSVNFKTPSKTLIKVNGIKECLNIELENLKNDGFLVGQIAMRKNIINLEREPLFIKLRCVALKKRVDNVKNVRNLSELKGKLSKACELRDLYQRKNKIECLQKKSLIDDISFKKEDKELDDRLNKLIERNNLTNLEDNDREIKVSSKKVFSNGLTYSEIINKVKNIEIKEYNKILDERKKKDKINENLEKEYEKDRESLKFKISKEYFGEDKFYFIQNWYGHDESCLEFKEIRGVIFLTHKEEVDCCPEYVREFYKLATVFSIASKREIRMKENSNLEPFSFDKLGIKFFDTCPVNDENPIYIKTEFGFKPISKYTLKSIEPRYLQKTLSSFNFKPSSFGFSPSTKIVEKWIENKNKEKISFNKMDVKSYEEKRFKLKLINKFSILGDLIEFEEQNVIYPTFNEQFKHGEILGTCGVKINRKKIKQNKQKEGGRGKSKKKEHPRVKTKTPNIYREIGNSIRLKDPSHLEINLEGAANSLEKQYGLYLEKKEKTILRLHPIKVESPIEKEIKRLNEVNKSIRREKTYKEISELDLFKEIEKFKCNYRLKAVGLTDSEKETKLIKICQKIKDLENKT